MTTEGLARITLLRSSVTSGSCQILVLCSAKFCFFESQPGDLKLRCAILAGESPKRIADLQPGVGAVLAMTVRGRQTVLEETALEETVLEKTTLEKTALQGQTLLKKANDVDHGNLSVVKRF